jgi:hypothetical protein
MFLAIEYGYCVGGIHKVSIQDRVFFIYLQSPVSNVVHGTFGLHQEDTIVLSKYRYFSQHQYTPLPETESVSRDLLNESHFDSKDNKDNGPQTSVLTYRGLTAEII